MYSLLQQSGLLPEGWKQHRLHTGLQQVRDQRQLYFRFKFAGLRESVTDLTSAVSDHRLYLKDGHSRLNGMLWLGVMAVAVSGFWI